jgi:protein-L-isoaspartate O-methyltransferase
MDWAREFYAKQYVWSRFYKGRGLEILDSDRRRVAAVERHAGPGRKRILEIGCGGGWTAAALADVGHTVVAVEREPALAANARALAAEKLQRNLYVIEADFYEVEPPAPFEVVFGTSGARIAKPMKKIASR